MNTYKNTGFVHLRSSGSTQAICGTEGKEVSLFNLCHTNLAYRNFVNLRSSDCTEGWLAANFMKPTISVRKDSTHTLSGSEKYLPSRLDLLAAQKQEGIVCKRDLRVNNRAPSTDYRVPSKQDWSASTQGLLAAGSDV